MATYDGYIVEEEGQNSFELPRAKRTTVLCVTLDSGPELPGNKQWSKAALISLLPSDTTQPISPCPIHLACTIIADGPANPRRFAV